MAAEAETLTTGIKRSTARSRRRLPIRAAGLVCIAAGLTLLGILALWFRLHRDVPAAALPPAGEVLNVEPPFRFAIISDTRGNMSAFQAGLSRIKGTDASLILHAGDIARRVNERQFNWVLQGIGEADLSVPLCVVPGNHDIAEDARDIKERYRFYNRAFGPRRYWFGHGSALFVAFDDATEKVSPESLRWLDEVLRRHRGDYDLCFVWCHVPPRTVGVHHSLTDGDSEKLMRVLNGHEVDALFTGHLHSYAEYELHGVPVYSTGGLGEDGPPGEPHGFLLCDVGADGTFSVGRQEVPLTPNNDYPAYAFLVKLPGTAVLFGSSLLLLLGAALVTSGSERARR